MFKNDISISALHNIRIYDTDIMTEKSRDQIVDAFNNLKTLNTDNLNIDAIDSRSIHSSEISARQLSVMTLSVENDADINNLTVNNLIVNGTNINDVINNNNYVSKTTIYSALSDITESTPFGDIITSLIKLKDLVK